MDKQQQNTRTMIQGVINNVFDICEANGVMPEREDFCYAINFWMEHSLLVKCLPGIPNKRLPVPEINYVAEKEPNHCVICDKYTDGQTVIDNETVWMCFDCYTNTPEELEPYEEAFK